MTVSATETLSYGIPSHRIFIMILPPSISGTIALSSPHTFVQAPPCHFLELAPRFPVAADWAGGGRTPHLQLILLGSFPSDILQSWEMLFGMGSRSILHVWTRKMEETVLEREGRVR